MAEQERITVGCQACGHYRFTHDAQGRCTVGWRYLYECPCPGYVGPRAGRPRPARQGVSHERSV